MTEELRIPVTGGELAVTDYGGPGRTVVLVHSVGYSSDVWRRFAPLLAESSRVLAVDLRGHGQSTAQLSEVLEIAADLETLVADLDLRCPVLIGHQYGGGVAAVIASLSPLLWGGLCVIDSPVTSSQAEYRGLLDIVSSEPVRDELANRFAFGASGVGEQSRERFLQEAGRRMADDWLSLPRVGSEDYQLSRSVLTNPETGEWVRQPTRRTVELLTTVDDRFPVPGRELLERVIAPVWVLQPDDGEYGDGFDEVTAMAAGRLGWATTRLPGGSFMAHTHPEVLRDALVTLLSSLPKQQEPDRHSLTDRARPTET